MSDLVVNHYNSATEVKKRTAAALVRFIQELTPNIEQSKLILQEVNDVVEVYGTLTDADLVELGITAVTLGSFITFLTKLNEFIDKVPTSGKAYRTSINSVKRIGAMG